MSVALRNIVIQNLIFLEKNYFKLTLDSGGIHGRSLNVPYSYIRSSSGLEPMKNIKIFSKIYFLKMSPCPKMMSHLF